MGGTVKSAFFTVSFFNFAPSFFRSAGSTEPPIVSEVNEVNAAFSGLSAAMLCYTCRTA